MKLAAVFRRTPCERFTAGLIGLGLAMLMQPWSLDVYSYGFTVLLAGVVGYSIAGKLPSQRRAAPELTQPPRGAAAALRRRLRALSTD